MAKTAMKQFVLSVYADGSVKITERAVTKRTKDGRFASPYAVRFRKPVKRTCGFAEICPFAM